MKRKMIGAAAAYLSGLFFASFFTDKFGIILIIIIPVIVFEIAKVRKFSRFDLYIIFFSFLTALTVSLTYTLKCYYSVTDFEGTKGSFSGKVTDYEVYTGDRASYILDGIINDKQKAEIILYCYETGAEYGDIITLENCDFLAIENDYLFGAKDYYKSRHIFLRVNGAESIDVRYTDSAKFKKMLFSFRENMIDKIFMNIGEDTGGFLTGMIFGEKRYLDENIKISLYRSGIGHILAVSGLHISVIASMVMLIMNKMKVNKFISFGIMNLLLLLFITLANYPVSAIRSAIMLDIMYSAPFFRRQNDSLNSIAVAVFIISIADPYSVYNSGFILSISGTFGVAVFGKYMAEKTEGKISSAFIISLCTTFSVMPVVLYYFDETSLISPLADVILVPLCTLAMIFGLLYIITGGLLPVLLYVADILIKIVINVSDIFSSVSFLHISQINNIFPLILILSGFVIICLFLFKGGKRLLTVSISLTSVICCVLIVISAKIRNENMIVAVLGNRNNCVVAVSYDGRTDIIDLSGHYRSAEYVRKYLSENGINKINSLILTNDTASQDIIYETNLQPFTVGERFAVKNIDIYNGRLKLLGDSGFTSDSGDYSIRYYDDVLSVDYNECEINFSLAMDNVQTDGLSVYYGNITKNTEVYEDGIYLDEINNFEIILSADGQYKMRSLYVEN